MRVVLMAAMLLAVSMGGVSAQSFDCAKARLDTEVAICNSARLSRLDEEMASLYFGLPHYVRKDIGREQLRWLRRRNACGYNVQCIARAYHQRIGTLSGY
jgi:uncharacterized protein